MVYLRNLLRQLLIIQNNIQRDFLKIIILEIIRRSAAFPVKIKKLQNRFQIFLENLEKCSPSPDVYFPQQFINFDVFFQALKSSYYLVSPIYPKALLLIN